MGLPGIKITDLMALLRKLFWVALFVIATLSFVVLFEKGPQNFIPNLQKQIEEFTKTVKEQINPPKPAKP